MTILSIDFDVIMSPSINFYNDIVETIRPISELIQENPCIENGIQANLGQYQYLTEELVKIAKNNIPIIFIAGHDNLIGVAEKRNYSQVDLINIDHHHDIGYEINNWDLPISYKDLDCGNWVKYGFDKKIFKSYTWIKNENSYLPNKKGQNKYITKIENFKDFTNKPFPKVDEVIICGSFEWIPLNYQPLFYTWQQICGIIQNKEIEIDIF